MSVPLANYRPALLAALNADSALVASVTHAGRVCIFGGELPSDRPLTTDAAERAVPLEALVVAGGGGGSDSGDQGLTIGTPRALMQAYAPTRARALDLWYRALAALAPKTRTLAGVHFDCRHASGPVDDYEPKTRFPFAAGYVELTTLKVA
jgi:hypothetical protein